MRTMAIAAGFALLCAAASPVLAADMPVKATKEARVVAEPVLFPRDTLLVGPLRAETGRRFIDAGRPGR